MHIGFNKLAVCWITMSDIRRVTFFLTFYRFLISFLPTFSMHFYLSLLNWYIFCIAKWLRENKKISKQTFILITPKKHHSLLIFDTYIKIFVEKYLKTDIKSFIKQNTSVNFINDLFYILIHTADSNRAECANYF